MEISKIQAEYYEYLKNHVQKAFSLGAWYEHSNGGETIDADTHDVLVADVSFEVGKELSNIIGGTSS